MIDDKLNNQKKKENQSEQSVMQFQSKNQFARFGQLLQISEKVLTQLEITSQESSTKYINQKHHQAIPQVQPVQGSPSMNQLRLLKKDSDEQRLIRASLKHQLCKNRLLAAVLFSMLKNAQTCLTYQQIKQKITQFFYNNANIQSLHQKKQKTLINNVSKRCYDILQVMEGVNAIKIIQEPEGEKQKKYKKKNRRYYYHKYEPLVNRVNGESCYHLKKQEMKGRQEENR